MRICSMRAVASCVAQARSLFKRRTIVVSLASTGLPSESEENTLALIRTTKSIIAILTSDIARIERYCGTTVHRYAVTKVTPISVES